MVTATMIIAVVATRAKNRYRALVIPPNNHDPRLLCVLYTQHGKTRCRRYGRSLELVTTADKAPDMTIGSYSFLKVLQENLRASERTRTAFLLITSVRSVVAECCRGMRIAHR
jgi:hypothetical protein